MSITNEYEFIQLQKIGKIVGTVLKKMSEKLQAGITTLELDAYGGKLLAHGVPSERKIKPGDMVNIDVSAELNGFFGDTGGSYIVPPSSELKEALCKTTQQALQNALNVARSGNKLNLIGKAVEQTANRFGFKIIENIGSHGVGKHLHEAPAFIANYFDHRDQRYLTDGLVITIEPFISTHSTLVKEQKDGWTLSGKKGNLSAQYEHTMVITKGKPILLTAV